MTVRDYIENREFSTYGKRIRVLSASTHRNCGRWVENSDKKVKDIKVTKKIIFIFI